MSIHLEASRGSIAETVLLPGDPLRAKHVAEELLQNSKCYNNVRGMLGFTGYYQGHLVSIQGTGMGMPSTAIYVNELVKEYGVKRLVRVGTCGSIQGEMDIGDIILATSASGDSHTNKLYFGGMDFAPTADFELLYNAYQRARLMNIPVNPGPIFSTDTFFDDKPDRWTIWAEHGILAVEMETQMLYTLAARFEVKALSILTVSDSLVTGKAASHQDREKGFMKMMKLALESTIISNLD